MGGLLKQGNKIITKVFQTVLYLDAHKIRFNGYDRRDVHVESDDCDVIFPRLKYLQIKPIAEYFVGQGWRVVKDTRAELSLKRTRKEVGKAEVDNYLIR